MADSSRRLITLISTILDLSKMDAGMMEYRIVPTDLKRITDMSSIKSVSWPTRNTCNSSLKHRRSAYG
jgi:signal transduction histidine kinase